MLGSPFVAVTRRPPAITGLAQSAVGSSGRRPRTRVAHIGEPAAEDLDSMTTEHVAAAINPWEVAQRQFDLAADRLSLDPGLRRGLRAPPDRKSTRLNSSHSQNSYAR